MLWEKKAIPAERFKKPPLCALVCVFSFSLSDFCQVFLLIYINIYKKSDDKTEREEKLPAGVSIQTVCSVCSFKRRSRSLLNTKKIHNQTGYIYSDACAGLSP